MPTLAKSIDCTGCSACYNACLHKAIIMVADKEGFLYPKVIIDKCVGCKLCERKGVSLVLVNNDKGKKALSLLTDCFIEERPLTEALAQNANLNYPSPCNKERYKITSAFINPTTTLNDIDSQYNLVDHSIKGFVKEWSVRLNLFIPVKQLYNFVMANIHISTNNMTSATKSIEGGKAQALSLNLFVSNRRGA